MNLTKPKHIKENVWQQHLNWMQVMQAGQLTNDAVIKQRRQTTSKNSSKADE